MFLINLCDRILYEAHQALSRPCHTLRETGKLCAAVQIRSDWQRAMAMQKARRLYSTVSTRFDKTSLTASESSHGVSYQVLQLVPSYLGTCVGLARCGSSLIVSASDVNHPWHLASEATVIGHRDREKVPSGKRSRGAPKLRSMY